MGLVCNVWRGEVDTIRGEQQGQRQVGGGASSNPPSAPRCCSAGCRLWCLQEVLRLPKWVWGVVKGGVDGVRFRVRFAPLGC